MTADQLPAPTPERDGLYLRLCRMLGVPADTSDDDLIEAVRGLLVREARSGRPAEPEPSIEVAPEVEVRYAGGPTIRITGYSVTTDAETGLIVVEGFITSRTGQPPSGDTVRLAYLGIPGRGALADITATVKVFSRLEVLNIRIRTTIRAGEAA